MRNEYLLMAAVRSHDFQTYLENTSPEDIHPVNHKTCLLYFALTYHNTQVALDLIQRGFDVNFRDVDGDTPLHLAAVYVNPQVTRELLARGARVDLQDIDGNTPLYYAVYYAKEDSEVVKLLMQYHSDPHSLNKSQHSILDLAEYKHRLDLIEIMKDTSLLAASPQVNSTNWPKTMPQPNRQPRHNGENFRQIPGQICLKMIYLIVIGFIGMLILSIPDFKTLPVWKTFSLWVVILIYFLLSTLNSLQSRPVYSFLTKYLLLGSLFALGLNYLDYFSHHIDTDFHSWAIVLPLILLFFALFFLPAYNFQGVDDLHQEILEPKSTPNHLLLLFLPISNLLLALAWVWLFPNRMTTGTFIALILAEDCVLVSYCLVFPFGYKFWEERLRKKDNSLFSAKSKGPRG